MKKTKVDVMLSSTDMAGHQSCQAALGENVPALHGRHHHDHRLRTRSQAAPQRRSTTFGVGAFGLPIDDAITGIAETLTVFNAVAISRLVVDEAINIEATSSCFVSSEEATLSAGCCGFGKTPADFPFGWLLLVMTSG